MNQNQTNESELGAVIQNQQINLENPNPPKPEINTMEEMMKHYNYILFKDAINTVSFANPFDAIAQSTYCGIKDSKFSLTSILETDIGARDEEHFKVILPTPKGKELCFIIEEKSDTFQRFCVEKSRRKFELSFYYNKNIDPQLPPAYDYSKSFIKAIRIGGGFCTSRQEVRVIFPDTQQTIGRIVVNELETNVHDSNDNLKYIIKFHYPLTKVTDGCCCCEKTHYERIELDPSVNTFFKIYQNNQEVGEINGIPYKITFPLQASVEDKILLIIARIFITYVVDISDTMGKKCLDNFADNCPIGLCFKCCLK